MIPFPHVLTVPCCDNDYQLRIVSDIPIFTGNVIRCTGRQRSYQIGEVILQRPARGDWSVYPSHPFYYQCTGSEFKEEEQNKETPESHELKQKQVFPV